MAESVNILFEKLTALGSAILGLVVFLAPLLLLNVAPPLASSAPVAIGALNIPSNYLVGSVFLIGGAILFVNASRKRG